MRSVAHSGVTGDIVTQWKPKGTNGWNYYGKITGIYHLNNRSYRDNSQPTTKVGDSYMYSTPYRAYFWTCSGPSFNFEFEPDGDPYNDYRSYSNTSSFSHYPVSGLIKSWGCRSAYPFDPSLPHGLTQRCISSVNEKLKNNSFDIGQSAGEMRETANFIISTLTSLCKAFLAALRLDGRAVARYLGVAWNRRIFKDVSKLWLSYQYGWKPLMNDIYDSARTLRDGLMPNANPSITSVKMDSSFKAPVLPDTLQGEVSGEYERGVEVGVKYFISSQYLYDLDRYGILDPLSVAWELVPLSFVVDWFTGIGAFLDSLSRPLGLTFLTGYKTEFVKVRGKIRYWWAGVSLKGGSPPTLDFRLRSSRRQTYLTWPIALPYLDLNIDTSKLANLLALVVANS